MAQSRPSRMQINTLHKQELRRVSDFHNIYQRSALTTSRVGAIAPDHALSIVANKSRSADPPRHHYVSSFTSSVYNLNILDSFDVHLTQPRRLYGLLQRWSGARKSGIRVNYVGPRFSGCAPLVGRKCWGVAAMSVIIRLLTPPRNQLALGE
jgi:hypothetical protein